MASTVWAPKSLASTAESLEPPSMILVPLRLVSAKSPSSLNLTLSLCSPLSPDEAAIGSGFVCATGPLKRQSQRCGRKAG